MLPRLLIYQTDDSGSMAEDGRIERARELVALITEVATKFVEVNTGVHLRFINKDDSTANNLRTSEVMQRMSFTPQGWTELGTNLTKKILQPMVYDVIAHGVLKRPFLILTITDGVPSRENSGEFRKAIVRCKKELRDRGYQKEGTLFPAHIRAPSKLTRGQLSFLISAKLGMTPTRLRL